MSDYTQSYRKYALSLRSSSLYYALYKPADLVGLVKKGLQSMLYLGLFFLPVLGPIRYTQSLFLSSFSKITIYFISFS